MTKVVINTCYGGFGLSDEAVELYAKIKGINLGPRIPSTIGDSHWYIDGIHEDDNYFSSYSIEGRTDPALIQVVESLGERANGWVAELRVVEIPDDVEWYIEEYDGTEWVAEKHRTWR